MKKLLTIITAITLLNGCATMDPFGVKAAHAQWWDLWKDCEMGTAHLTEEEERKLIAQKQIEVGMSECALIHSKGLATGGANYSTGTWGTHIQYVYGGYRYSGGYEFGEKASYVYVENGIVTSWQN